VTIQEATQKYEAWVSSQVRTLAADLQTKHRKMAQDPFSFLRATFYRWAQLWPERCPELAKGPVVLAVGDLHVENFGTWRDAEGRLIWGINDLDEACKLSYANDLVRLATSALVAIRVGDLSIGAGTACDAVLDGYRESLGQGGLPFVLSERHRWLRDLATNSLRDPVRFWERFDELPTVRSVPIDAMFILKASMPEPGLTFRVVHREAGLGSLGRQRFTALALWRGGKIAREVKELLPSAARWEAKAANGRIHYEKALVQAVRATDPFVGLREHWLLRRLSPYCSRIELSTLPRGRDEEKLLHSMGWETANIHLGNRTAVPAVLKDLRGRKPKWLRQASQTMAEAVVEEWHAWKQD